MTLTIKQLERDSTWKRSLGEKLGKIHFRKGNLHAECNPTTGICEIHRDKTDPHESISSLLKHMSESNGGKVVLGVIVVGILDQVLTGGAIRKSFLRI
ncbi:MAG: hypothetical protein CO032_04320 [Nitrosopumilales archaeon CG_4_9_14_0_2_um_filter_34_16]|nr:MAG: hypothetical protein CO032_04320 [Nitrosopumilales archaeon CG_4_9_14_0_2_um_filter_34_16]